MKPLLHLQGGPCTPDVRTRFAHPGFLQSCAILLRFLRQLTVLFCLDCTKIKNSVVMLSRAPAEVCGMSTPTACLLVSKFAPAAARVFADFRRLRGSLPPADAREFAEHQTCVQDVDLMTAVRFSACHAKQRARGFAGL